MYNCSLSAFCTKTYCDKSCPALAESSYLLERNNIEITNPVFRVNESSVLKVFSVLEQNEGQLITWESPGNPEGSADVFTYCAICKHWNGSKLHCSVYHLNFSRYIELIKKSWSTNSEPEELEYMKIWIEKSTVLVISGFRYMRFNDFECQTMLNLLDNRRNKMRTTVVVAASVDSISGNSADFLLRLKEILRGAVVK